MSATDKHSASDEHVCCHHVAGLRSIKDDRERELLELKGPCSNSACSLHYAHSGPCNSLNDSK
jgi:hypothetical protein